MVLDYNLVVSIRVFIRDMSASNLRSGNTDIRVSNIEAELQSFARTVAEQNDKISNIDNKVDAKVSERFSKFNAEQNDVIKRLEILEERKMPNQNEKLNQLLDDRLDEFTDDIRLTSKEQDEQLREQMTALKEALSSSLVNNKTQLDSKISELMRQINELKQSISPVTRTSTEHNTKLAELEKQLSDLLTSFSAAQTTINTLNSNTLPFNQAEKDAITDDVTQQLEAAKSQFATKLELKSVKQQQTDFNTMKDAQTVQLSNLAQELNRIKEASTSASVGQEDFNSLKQKIAELEEATAKNTSTIAILEQMNMPLPVPPSSFQQGTISTQHASMTSDIANQIATLSQEIADSDTLTPKLKQKINSILLKLDRTDPHTKDLVSLLENISQKVDTCLSTMAQQSVDPTSTELNKELDEQLNNAVNEAKKYADQAKQYAEQPVSQPIPDNTEALKMAQEAKTAVDELKKEVAKCCADKANQATPPQDLSKLEKQIKELQNEVKILKQRASTPQPVQTPDPGLVNRLSSLEVTVKRNALSVPSSVTTRLDKLEAKINEATARPTVSTPLQQPPQATPEQLNKIKRDIQATVMAELDKNKINATTVNQGLTKIDQLFQDMNNNRYLTKDELNAKVNELSGQFADLEKIKKALRVLLEDSIYHHGEQSRGLPIAFSY